MSESITVSALNRYARALIEYDEVLSQVWVEGEITGFSVHQKSGHAYFSLRDSASSVRAVMFNAYASALRFLPKDGMYVVAKCKVTLYERDGSFQISVFDLMPRGAGAVQQQADQVKEKLTQEGIFAPERKRRLPGRPKKIAVVTSASSAAWQDIISVAARRDPTAHLRVYSANVQGLQSVESLIRAIRRLNADKWADVAIIARGGGSKEDLWYFNDEELVRAASRLSMPFISAVGHETDYTLIDFVSDARAPTPSAAAELAVHDIFSDLADARALHEEISRRFAFMLESKNEALTAFRTGLTDTVNASLARRLYRLDTAGRLCRSLDPIHVLMRGYSHAVKDGAGITSVTQLTEGDELNVRFYDGTALCSVERIIAKGREQHG